MKNTVSWAIMAIIWQVFIFKVKESAELRKELHGYRKSQIWDSSPGCSNR
jgi:hypothetical protein